MCKEDQWWEVDAKLSAGDVVARELKYQPTCWIALYNREQAHLHELKETEEMERNAAYSIAFSELVTYITETTVACESSNPPIFRLCDLCLLYRERLEQLVIESPAVHATRLKDQLLVQIPELQAHREGHDVMLAFEKDAGQIWRSYSSGTGCRNDMAWHASAQITVQQHLPWWISWRCCPLITASICTHDQTWNRYQITASTYEASKSDLAVSHLLQYNCFAKYIDHNPTATAAKTSFHGASISIFQHPSSEQLGEEREPIKLNADVKLKKVPELPDAFTNVWPAFITKNPNPPTAGSLPYPAPESIWSHLKEEYAWLEKVSLSQSVDDAIRITCASHHAMQKRSQPFEVSITSLLPLLRDQAHSVATLKHTMKKIRDTVAFLNPGQTQSKRLSSHCMLYENKSNGSDQSMERTSLS